MLLIICCDSIISNSRVLKYIDYLNNTKEPYHVLGWNRGNEQLPINENISYYSKQFGYKTGGIRAIIGRLYWMSYVIRYLRRNKERFHVIHACDIDTAFPSVIFKIFFNRKVKIIFDIFDWASDNIASQKPILHYIISLMEKITAKNVDTIIICEQERINQIPFKINKDIIVLPNIPSFGDLSFLKKDEKYLFNNNLITLSYVGGFGEDRCLKELLQLVKNNVINLLIAGFGNKELQETCLSLSKTHQNIKYFGKVPYNEALIIQYNADAIFAMYQKISKNNVFAAPNKYYEAMMLGKAIISTKGIILEPKIIANDMGYVVDESYSDIEYLIKTINQKDLKTKGNNARCIWERKYSSYINSFMTNTYSMLIK